MSTIIRIEKIVKHYRLKSARVTLFKRSNKVVHAVDGVSLPILKSETFGLVGESGCGKTTLGKLVLRLIEPTSGSIVFEGKDILALDKKEWKKTQREMQLVFQDTASSLNPRKRVRDILARPFLVHKTADKKEIPRAVSELLQEVGLTPEFLDRYPHELSGGQKQRIAIARAVALHPRFLVADEPVASLDMSSRSQILNLMKSLRSKYGLTILFITHDLAVVRNIADRVGVMYLGKLVELADVEDIYTDPLHPYTKALLSATPTPDSKQRNREHSVLMGEVPSPIDPPAGCRFNTRCPFVFSECKEKEPPLIEIAERHYAACFLHSSRKASAL